MDETTDEVFGEMTTSATDPGALEIDPPGAAGYTIIWLHGLGADGYDFEPIVPQLDLPRDPGVRFVFPHAPERPVTVNGGMVMRAWYDIGGTALDKAVKGEEIIESAERIRELVERETAGGIPADRIVLAGFSQGGTVALQAALETDTRLAGVLALSTWLPDDPGLRERYGAANRDLPVFMAHGLLDPMVPCQLGVMTREYLRGLGSPVTWNEYMMEHGVCNEEIRDISIWLGGLPAFSSATGE